MTSSNPRKRTRGEIEVSDHSDDETESCNPTKKSRYDENHELKSKSNDESDDNTFSTPKSIQNESKSKGKENDNKNNDVSSDDENDDDIHTAKTNHIVNKGNYYSNKGGSVDIISFDAESLSLPEPHDASTGNTNNNNNNNNILQSDDGNKVNIISFDVPGPPKLPLPHNVTTTKTNENNKNISSSQPNIDDNKNEDILPSQLNDDNLTVHNDLHQKQNDIENGGDQNTSKAIKLSNSANSTKSESDGMSIESGPNQIEMISNTLSEVSKKLNRVEFIVDNNICDKFKILESHKNEQETWNKSKQMEWEKKFNDLDKKVKEYKMKQKEIEDDIKESCKKIDGLQYDLKMVTMNINTNNKIYTDQIIAMKQTLNLHSNHIKKINMENIQNNLSQIRAIPLNVRSTKQTPSSLTSPVLITSSSTSTDNTNIRNNKSIDFVLEADKILICDARYSQKVFKLNDTQCKGVSAMNPIEPLVKGMNLVLDDVINRDYNQQILPTQGDFGGNTIHHYAKVFNINKTGTQSMTPNAISSIETDQLFAYIHTQHIPEGQCDSMKVVQISYTGSSKLDYAALRLFLSAFPNQNVPALIHLVSATRASLEIDGSNKIQINGEREDNQYYLTKRVNGMRLTIEKEKIKPTEYRNITLLIYYLKNDENTIKNNDGSIIRMDDRPTFVPLKRRNNNNKPRNNNGNNRNWT